MRYSGFSEKPTNLGGYSTDAFIKLTGFLIDTIPEYKNVDMIISGMGLGFEQALAMAAIELNIPFISVLTNKDFGNNWPPSSQTLLENLNSKAKEVIYASNQNLWNTNNFRKRNQKIDSLSDVYFSLFKSDFFKLSVSDFKIVLSNDNIPFPIEDDSEKLIYNLWPKWELYNGEIEYIGFRNIMLYYLMEESL